MAKKFLGVKVKDLAQQKLNLEGAMASSLIWTALDKFELLAALDTNLEESLTVKDVKALQDAKVQADAKAFASCNQEIAATLRRWFKGVDSEAYYKAKEIEIRLERWESKL